MSKPKTKTTNDVQKETTVVETKQLAKEDQKTFDSLTTTSAKIRFLDQCRYTTSQICKDFGIKTRKGLPIRYQHVRNVLTTPLKRVVAADKA